MKPRQYVHSLLMLSEVFIIICLILYFSTYLKIDKDYFIWIGSKILTTNKLMTDNNYNIYPVLNIYMDGSEEFYKYDYSYLLEHSHKPCEENHKKCGNLDSLGNIMCIPENDDCPINDVKIDLTSKSNEYISNEYKMGYLNNLPESYSLYYTNKATENNIIVKFKFINIEEPRYINEDNFIFDIDTYYGLKGRSTGDYNSFGGGGGGGGGSGGGGGAGSGGGGFRNLISYDLNNITDSELKKYILKQIENDINIDKSFNYVSNKLYVGNYIGFKDSSHLNIYNSVFSNRCLYIGFPEGIGFF